MSNTQPTKHLNTTAVLKNTYSSGDKIKIGFETPKITVDPTLESRYDETYTEDIILLNDRKETQHIMYELFKASPYADKYASVCEDAGLSGDARIDKADIRDVFYYAYDSLTKAKALSMFETIIAINEFFDFNYDYIVKHVLTPKIKADLYQEYYDNGMKHRMDETISQSLF